MQRLRRFGAARPDRRLQNRIEALKAKAETLGKQLADLSYLTNGNVITTVSQDADGKYVVTYKDNKDVEHTVVLATMDDIVDVPIIGVKLDENDVYYWTKCIDGEITWLTDDDGEKFPVSGYTPTISVDADGCWTVDGVQILTLRAIRSRPRPTPRRYSARRSWTATAISA